LSKELLEKRRHSIRHPILHIGVIGCFDDLGRGNIHDVRQYCFYDRGKTHFAGPFGWVGQLHGNMHARHKKFLTGAGYTPAGQPDQKNHCASKNFRSPPKFLQLHGLSLFAVRNFKSPAQRC
jgi:hypothetical protein